MLKTHGTFPFFYRIRHVTFTARSRHCERAFFVLKSYSEGAVLFVNMILFFVSNGMDFDLAVTLSECFNG